jgi:glycolate oxidase iron-sulfur subunit
MKDPDCCCGFGGMMRVTHREISDRILEEKVRNIVKTRAETVVTGCPNCRTQLTDGLRRTGSAMEVLHTVELIALSMSPGDDGQAARDQGARKEKT